MPKCKRLCVNIRHGGLAEKSLCLNTISLSKYPLHFSPSSNLRSHSAAANSGCTREDSLNHHFHSAIVPLLTIFYNTMFISARRATADRNSLNFPTNDLALKKKKFKFICQFQILVVHTISAHPSSHFPSLYLALSAFLAACFPHDQPNPWLMPCSLSHPSVSIH